jgi:hypothetical protein
MITAPERAQDVGRALRAIRTERCVGGPQECPERAERMAANARIPELTSPEPPVTSPFHSRRTRREKVAIRHSHIARHCRWERCSISIALEATVAIPYDIVAP